MHSSSRVRTSRPLIRLFTYLFIITGQAVFTDYARGQGERGLQGGNICTISYLQMISWLQMLSRNNFLSVISINEVDNEFQSMIVLGK